MSGTACIGTVRIRRMREQDAKAAAALEASVSPEAWSERAFQEAVSDKNAIYLAAEQDGALVGCCGLWISLDEADLCNVAVDRAFWRRGIASRMIGELFAMGEAAGVRDFTLEVRKKSRAAVALYEKLGFAAEGVRRDFYKNPEDDALIMWKRRSDGADTAQEPADGIRFEHKQK